MRPIGSILSVGVALLLLSAVAVSQTADTAVWGDLYSMRERGIRQPDSIAVATPQLTDSPERALAQPAVTTFEIVRPVDRLTVGLNVRQAVILRWIVNGEPIANQRIDFSTSAGTLSQSVAETDDFGLAVVFVESPEAGEATISANYTGILSDVVVVGFEERDPDFDSYRSGDRDIQLQLQNKQIGFQTRTGVSHADALKIAEENDLRFVQTYYRGVYIFELRNAYSLDALHLLAKNLERLYPNEIRLAGPVFISAASTAPLLKSDQMLIGFIGPPSTTDLEKIDNDFPLGYPQLLSGCPTIYVATVDAGKQSQMNQIASNLVDDGNLDVTFAHPNFLIYIPESAGGNETADISCIGDSKISAGPTNPPNDPRYCGQWHHDNRGYDGGVADADIDTAEAWEVSTGDKTHPLLAIIDSSFSLTAGDLVPNLWTNLEDGTRGRDFDDDEHLSLLDNPVHPNSHGTSVAYIAGSVAHNTIDGRGVCPGCKLLLLRHSADMLSTTSAVCYAIFQKADVISNSWGSIFDYQSIKHAIATAADDHDIPVVFATASVTEENRCDSAAELSSIDEHVIAVSSVTYVDGRTPSGFGDCVDVLAPSRNGAYHGIATTAVDYVPAAGGIVHIPVDYFGGTSAATPMVSGAIGLMLDANQNLSRIQIQRALQDTADKVDPNGAHYDEETGFSMPQNLAATHAYGRINAFEAVSLVAPYDPAETDRMKRGHDGKDLLVRDHALDWGNTERPSNELFTQTTPRQTTSVTESIDIKIDVKPYENTPTSSFEFVDFDSENPVFGEPFRAYVRLRNRGPVTVGNATLKLHWTVAQSLPRLQDDFWLNFPNDTTEATGPQLWNPLPKVDLINIEYSGASVAGCKDPPDPGLVVPVRDSPRECLPNGQPATDLAKIVEFEIGAKNWDTSAGERISLLATAHSDEDPVLAKLGATSPVDLLNVENAVIWDNNVSVWVDPGANGNDETKPSCRNKWMIGLTVAFAILLSL